MSCHRTSLATKTGGKCGLVVVLCIVSALVATTATADWWAVNRADAEFDLPTARRAALATIATSTMGGRTFDFASRELGFGSTKGATARAKFVATIANQVLPLLKPTFGGSFSIQEGQELKASLADPDVSPEEKLAQLTAFLDQKERDILSKQRELLQSAAKDLSDDDLFK